MNSQVIHTVFEQHAFARPEHLAIVESGNSITYSQLNDEADRLASVLRGICRARASVVGVLLPSGISLVTAMLASFKAAMVYMPLDWAFGRRRLKDLLRNCDCTVLITDQESAGRLQALWQEVDSGSRTLLVTGDGGIRAYPATGGQFIPAAAPATGDSGLPQPADGNYIFSTSGTTGSCKAILGSHEALSHFIHWEIREFGLDADVRVSQLTSITFDASLRDVFAALAAGGTVYIPPADIRHNPAALIDWLDQNRISLVHCVPTLFRLLARELARMREAGITALRHLKYILMAGEPLYSKDIRIWYDADGNDTVLVNLYGTSETTLAKTFHRIGDIPDNPAQALHAGRPIDGSSVLIINSSGRLCRTGEIGEIYILPPFTPKGYYNNPALNEPAFIQNPLSANKEIVHKTGDMGRYTKDQNIEVIGRMDDQVKVNGIRVELGEIEAAVLGVPGIRETVVLAGKDDENRCDLVCYYVGDQLDDEQLRQYLDKELPHGLVPSFFFRFDSFPLTINGKIDKRALPKPRQLVERKLRYEAPVNETERKLEAIWKEVLGIDNIGRKTSFFEMGGNSLKSLLVLSRIYRIFGVVISVDVIFNERTLEAISKHIDRTLQQPVAHIRPLPPREYYDVSHSQLRAWIQHQAQPEKTLYNVAGAYAFDGTLDADRFRRAFRLLVTRHEILRTTFLLVNGEPKQKVNAYDPAIHEVGLTDLAAEPDPDGAASSIVSDISNTVFDLESSPLFKAMLIRLSDTRALFAFTMHHIISDAWSMEILTGEMTLLYNTGSLDDSVLPPLSIQYKEYADWQNKQLTGERLQAHRAFWLDQFKDSPATLHLPLDLDRPAHRTSQGISSIVPIDGETRLQLERLGRKVDATLFMTFVALLNIVLAKHSGQNDIILGTPVAGREFPGLENQIGFYINTLPIRMQMDRGLPFTHFMNAVREKVIAMLKFQAYPFDRLLEDLGIPIRADRNPLFDVGFTYIKENELNRQENQSGMTGLQVSYADNGFNLVKADIWFKVFENPDNLVMDITCNSSLFSSTYLHRLASDIQHTISAVIANPQSSIDEVISR
ncbi:MAG TPA: condensation domain-containing protein, partial [Puia sp.]|nr:condensation domain-containing protein [Puia sp.]